MAHLVREDGERAQKLLVDRRDGPDRVGARLLEEEIVDGDVVYRIVGRPVPGGRPQFLSSE
jgi:ATP-dependent Zn protease